MNLVPSRTKYLSNIGMCYFDAVSLILKYKWRGLWVQDLAALSPSFFLSHSWSMVFKYLPISKALSNISYFSFSQLFIQYWWFFIQFVLLSPPHVFGTVSLTTVVQAQISRILGVTYITITKTFLVPDVTQFFKDISECFQATFLCSILFLGVSTLRNPCHDLCCSIFSLSRKHQSFSAVFPPATSVMPLISAHLFLWEGLLQYHYLELFFASTSVLFKCNGLWYFNVLVNQQLNSFKKANQVPPSQVNFIQGPWISVCRLPHL